MTRSGAVALTAALVIACGACGRLGFDAVVEDEESLVSFELVDASLGEPDGGAESPDGGVRQAPCAWGSFSTPVRIAELASTAADYEPSVGEGELEIFFSSLRGGGSGGFDIFIATRDSISDPWSTPVSLPGVNGPEDDTAPAVSQDGRTLYFESRRGGTSTSSLWVATRNAPGEPFSRPTPLVGPDLAVPAGSPSITADGRELYYCTDFDLWVVSRTSTSLPFGGTRRVPGIDGTEVNCWPGISGDGLTLFWERAADLAASHEIWSATRPDRASRFTIVGRVPELALSDDDSDPQLSWDGRTLYFGSAADDPEGDLYTATRECR